MPLIKRKKTSVKVRNKNTDAMSRTELENLTHEFYQVNEQRKALEKREKELKSRLAKGMETHVETDVKGHRTFKFTNSEGKNVYLQRQLRRKTLLNQEKAVAFFGKAQPDIVRTRDKVAPEVTQDQILDVLAQHAEHFVEHESYVDESDIEQLVMDGVFSMEELENLVEHKDTYAMAFVPEKDIQEEEA